MTFLEEPLRATTRRVPAHRHSTFSKLTLHPDLSRRGIPDGLAPERMGQQKAPASTGLGKQKAGE